MLESMPQVVEPPQISLIMATYGRATEIGRLVDSLACQTERRFELIMADQNLDERVQPYVERARAAGIDVRHLRLSQPGLSAARNDGLQIARGEWVAFPDDDCWYAPDALEQLLAVAAQRPSVVGFVGHWIEQVEAHAEIAADEQRLQLKRWRRFRGGDASSITLFMRRVIVEELQGFDARLGVGRRFGSGEETDFVLRLLEAGAALERTRAVCVHHAFDRSDALALGKPSLWRFYSSRERGTGALYAKHRLSAWVILRGMAAPLLRGLSGRQGLPGVIKGAASSFGRLQGWITWPRR